MPVARALVLGSEGHGRHVRAHAWNRLPEGLNVADFDAVVLDFSAFAADEVRKDVDLERVPSLEQFVRLAFSEGATVIAVGDPTVEFGHQAPLFGRQLHWTYKQPTWWLPVDLPVKKEAGEVIRNVVDGWAFWFQHVRRFNWHFWRSPQPATDAYRRDTAVAAAPIGTAICLAEWAALAETRDGQPIGVQLRLVGVEGVRDRWGEEHFNVVAEAGRIYWLPEPTEIPTKDAIDLLLREVIGIAVEAPRPDWLKDYSLPRERAALSAVDKRRTDVDMANQALEEAEQRATQEGRFGQLLYEQGTAALEPVVRNAFAELGAEVHEPVNPGIEDGRLVDPAGRAWMLEIKGRTGQLRLEDVRQLDGWMRTAMADEGWDGKGIIAANLKLNETPRDRTDVVAPNALSFAERVGIAIVTTPQLFEALRGHQQNELDVEAFWDTVFSTSGLAALPGPS